jgi:2-phospho-L-lactate/phosphoenolpyruvate guanylyltransferase
MQASVHDFDASSGSGSVLLDDGVRLPFAPQAFWRSGLRLLRVGQRVSVEVEHDQVVALRVNGV